MNSKKWLFSFGVLLLGTPFLVTQARNVEMVQVKTVYTKPIDVRVDSKGLLVTGKAWLKNATPQDAKIITAQLIDKYGAEVWKKDIPWDPDFLVSDSRWTEQQIVVPFSHDFAKESVAGDFEVVFTTRNRKNKLTAKGSREISLIKREPVLKISDFQLKSTEQEATISFSAFRQGEEPQEASKPVSAILPRVNVFEHVSGGKLVYSEKGKALELNGNEKTIVSFKIPKPEQPESYVVEVQLLGKKDNPLTGILSKRLLVEGDFAEITSFTADPERFLETGESVTFSFIGVARKNEELLTMKIEATQKFRNKVLKTLKEKKDITEFDFAEFTESFTFPIVEPGASQFEVEVELIRNGEVIEEKTFTSEEFLKYDTPAYQAYDTVMSYDWLMWLVIVIVVSGLGFLVWKLRRRSKIFNLLFLGIMGLGMFSGVGYADDYDWTLYWFYPGAGDLFNPSSTEGFELIRFNGDLYDELIGDNGLGFFYDLEGEEVVPPDLVELRFIQEGETTISIDVTDDIQINDYGDNYVVEALLPSEDFEGKDGDWIPQIYFLISELDREAEVNSDNNATIKIDTQAPTLIFAYNPDEEGESNTTPTKDPIAVTVTCDDGELGSGCFPDLNPFEVKGNFGNGYVEENNGFEICDQVKNCTDFDTTELLIDFYDPVPPSFSGVVLENGNITLDGKGEGTLASSQSFTFNITNPSDPVSIDLELYPNLFDEHACGPIDDENGIYLQQPVALSWTSGTEEGGFTGFDIERRKGEAAWRPITNVLDAEKIIPLGSDQDYSFIDYSVSNADDYQYRLKSNGYENTSDPIGPGQEQTNFDLLNVKVAIFSVTADANKKCTTKETMCIENTIDRDNVVNRYAGGVCEFTTLPGDEQSLDECSDEGLFPLCFPFNLFSSGDTLPFELPFTLSGD